MGNENEIKELLEQSKAEFLPQDFEDPDGALDVYSLDEEFAKTRKNKSFLFTAFIVMFLFSVVVAGGILTFVIQQLGKESSVNIDDFSDIHVQEVMSENNNLEVELDTLKNELQELYDQLKEDILRVKEDFSAKRDNVHARALSEEEKDAELLQLDAELTATLSNVRRKYNSKIFAKKNKISEIEKRIADNKEKIKGSEGKEAVLNSTDLLQSIQINRIKDYYERKIERINSQHKRDLNKLERKYNPVFREAELQKIISKPAYRVKTPDKYLNNIDPDLKREKVAGQEAIDKLRVNIDRQLALIKRMQKIPYKNSVQRSLIHLESISKDISTQYDRILRSMVYENRRDNLRIGNFNYAFSYNLQNESENGYILDTRRSTRLGVFINPVHEIQSGDIALVFRQDDEYIGTIKFVKENGMLFAETVENAPGRLFHPFDKIMLKIVKVEK